MTLLTPELLPTKQYVFARWRRMLESGALQEGVMDAGDFKVTQRAASANKSVDIALGRAWVRGDDTTRQGFYHAENDGTVNLAVPDNASANPRVDQLVLRVYDSSVIGGGIDEARLEVLAGTPTAGAMLDNAAGITSRAALPPTAIRFAEWVAAPGFTQITNADIRDRRQFARGVRYAYHRTAGDYVLGTGGAFADLDATNLKPRLECSGADVIVTVMLASLATNLVGTGLFGLSVDGAAERQKVIRFTESGAAQQGMTLSWLVTGLTPGSHTFAIRLASIAGGSITLGATATVPFSATFAEDIRPSAANG